MDKYKLIPRVVENKDWITILFTLTVALVVITKVAFENRFAEFSRLLYSNKYLKIYKDSSNLMTWFTVLLFVAQLLSYSFFILLLLSVFDESKSFNKTNWITYIQVFTFLSFFVLSKFLIEKIVATAFNIESFTEQFNLFKISYRSYIGLLLLPVNLVFYYTTFLNKQTILAVVAVLLLINIITYIGSLRNYQNLLFSKLFYFILYICALEIAPYFFMYYAITKLN